ncbi:MAG: Fe-S cluster assembly protein SufD [Dehalococcoidia bacterium]|nr:Fe-S cluster assembly protein SufD [Dehalococcoidia bacterium]
MPTVTAPPTSPYQSAYDSLASQSAQQPAWLRDLRRNAMQRFAHLGFPTARRGNEPWKYTSVAPIAQAALAHDAAAGAATLAHLKRLAPWRDAWPRLVFVDGRYNARLSSCDSLPRGVRLHTLAHALATDPAALEPHLGHIASWTDDAFVALNTAFLADGAVLIIPPGAVLEEPVHILHVVTDGAGAIAAHPRTLVLAGDRSRAAIIETFVSASGAAYFTNAVTEIVAAPSAQIAHAKLMLEGAASYHVGGTCVRQAQDSAFTSASISSGAALARNNLAILLASPGASCNLSGLSLTAGSQHLDNTLSVDHAAPHTTSRQIYKGILDGQSRAVFVGRVLVRQGATKADAVQRSKNLLLSRGAEIDAKPSLEILTDDVRCSHGATAGELDQSALFYLMSRGLPRDAARSLLVQAFASEIIQSLAIAPLRTWLDRRLALPLAASHAEVPA